MTTVNAKGSLFAVLVWRASSTQWSCEQPSLSTLEHRFPLSTLGISQVVQPLSQASRGRKGERGTSPQAFLTSAPGTIRGSPQLCRRRGNLSDCWSQKGTTPRTFPSSN